MGHCLVFRLSCASSLRGMADASASFKWKKVRLRLVRLLFDFSIRLGHVLVLDQPAGLFVEEAPKSIFFGFCPDLLDILSFHRASPSFLFACYASLAFSKKE